jgi:hypothetical protein
MTTLVVGVLAFFCGVFYAEHRPSTHKHVEQKTEAVQDSVRIGHQLLR